MLLRKEEGQTSHAPHKRSKVVSFPDQWYTIDNKALKQDWKRTKIFTENSGKMPMMSHQIIVPVLQLKCGVH